MTIYALLIPNSTSPSEALLYDDGQVVDRLTAPGVESGLLESAGLIRAGHTEWGATDWRIECNGFKRFVLQSPAVQDAAVELGLTLSAHYTTKAAA